MERLWAEYGGFASRDLSEVALIYVLVEGPRRAAASRATVLAVLAACERAVGIRVPVLHLAPRTKEDAVRLPEVLRTCAGRRLPDGLAPRGSKVPRKAGLGAISRRSAGTPASGGRYSGGGTRKRIERFQPCTN